MATRWLEEVMGLMDQIEVAGAEEVGAYMSSSGIWAGGVSARNNADKRLRALSDLNRLVKVRGGYRLPTSQSEYGQHARSLTKCLVSILIAFPAAKIVRERMVSQIGLRPDAIVLLRRERQGFCFVLEVMNTEKQSYFRKKVDAWQSWPGAPEYFGQLFGFRIPEFRIVRSEDLEGLLEALKGPSSQLPLWEEFR